MVHNTRSSRQVCIVSVNYVLSEQEAKDLVLNEIQTGIIKSEPISTSAPHTNASFTCQSCRQPSPWQI
ncbi:hypothetical protein DOY81_010014 [Sarcophaga bullata]|nr:hypothetical protein DOY81_010014 [Sarcophaga bullata]